MPALRRKYLHPEIFKKQKSTLTGAFYLRILFLFLCFLRKDFCVNSCNMMFLNLSYGEFNALLFNNRVFVLFRNSSENIHNKSGKGIVIRILINFDIEKFFDIA